jgi:hypothetical protein
MKMAPPHHAREGGQRAMAAEGPRSFYRLLRSIANGFGSSVGVYVVLRVECFGVDRERIG